MTKDYITPPQLRAARALLGWSREQCSRFSGVSLDQIRNLEAERRKVSRPTIKLLIDAFAARGVVFIGLDGVILLSSKIAKETPFAEIASVLAANDVQNAAAKIYAGAPPLI